MTVENKVVLITGAARGLGREYAVSLAAAGARVALVGRDAARGRARLDKIAQGGGQAEFFALHKLNDLAAQQIYRGNQHGILTETPALASSSLSARALETPK